MGWSHVRFNFVGRKGAGMESVAFIVAGFLIGYFTREIVTMIRLRGAR